MINAIDLSPHAEGTAYLAVTGYKLNDFNPYIYKTTNHGDSWKHSDNSALGNECQVVELLDGQLMLCGRNQNKKGGTPFHRLVSYSSDGGVTWSDSKLDDELLEPICQASMLRYSWPTNGQKSGPQSRSAILFSNPADEEERVRLTVRLSYDEGRTWPVKRVVHPERCEYSCLTVLSNDMIGLLFKGDRRIMFTKFTLNWLTGGTD